MLLLQQDKVGRTPRNRSGQVVLGRRRAKENSYGHPTELVEVRMEIIKVALIEKRD